MTIYFYLGKYIHFLSTCLVGVEGGKSNLLLFVWWVKSGRYIIFVIFN